MRLNQLLKLGFLRDKIGLQKKDTLAATVCVVRGAAKARALDKEIQVPLRP
jgi:hypothetical protein